jgi:dipeptidyl aminopeptidase/acylaminoacyl peptidase
MSRLAAAFCLSVLPVISAPVKTLKPMDVFELETPASPQISPDGKRVAYVRQFADILEDKRRSNIWIVNFDGSDHRPLTSGKYGDSAPQWSADGSQLIFVSDRDGTPQIYRMWLNTGQIAKLTSLTQPPAGLRWSPDGKWISFTMNVPDKPRKLIEMPQAPEGAKWAEPAKVIDRTVYRFNALGYLKPGYQHVFIVPAEGGTPRQVSSGNFQHGGPSPVSDAVWTPDGRSLLMSLNRHDKFEDDPLNTEIYEYDLATGAVRTLTSRMGPDNAPVVSPDGKLVAYTGFEDKRLGHQAARLSVMNRDGSGARLLTADLDLSVGEVQWAPDSKGVYFVADEKGHTGLYFMPLGGKSSRLASGLGAGRSGSGGGSTVSVAANGHLAFLTQSVHLPGDVTVMRPGGSPQVVTSVNSDLLTDRELGAVEEIWYQSAKDKRNIQGWIVKPPGFDPARKYPLILEIHGGPFANYGPRFDLEKQMMAASGYVVLYTNPRGSTSYGEEFANLIHHAYPGDDFFDLNSGVDAMLAKGYIDPERLYVTGGSGGGVLTCWMIGRTTRFRAAVTIYPVINWYSWLLTSDIGPWIGKYWFPARPWDDPQHYEKRSLLSVVKNVKTPTMVLTGEADWRTPISDSEQYYQALRMLGVESVLVRVPDEPHGIQVRPSHHIAKMLYILSWFDSHGGRNDGSKAAPPASAAGSN